MISLIIPTYNEARNLPKLIPLISKSLKSTGQPFEIIIVDDDSPDKTWQLASRMSSSYPALKVIRRKHDKGLAKAVIEGFSRSKGDIIGVIDADLSHPPALIAGLARACKENDIVIASRYISDAPRAEFSAFRKAVSVAATAMARPLTNVKDPMSGYFFFRRRIIKGIRLAPTGYKILLEILVKARYDRSKVKEIPFEFGKRYFGKSKLGFWVYIDYILHLVALYFYRLVHRRSD